MPPKPPKQTNVNPMGVLGATLFGGVTMILTMLAMLFFPLAAFLGSFLDILSSLNPFKRRKKTATSPSEEADAPNVAPSEKP